MLIILSHNSFFWALAKHYTTQHTRITHSPHRQVSILLQSKENATRACIQRVNKDLGVARGCELRAPARTSRVCAALFTCHLH